MSDNGTLLPSGPSETSGGGGGTIDPTITQHLNDNKYLTMGGTAVSPEFQIGYQTTGLAAGRGLLTIPDGKFTVITSQANAGYDFLGVDPGPIPVPLLVMTSANQVQNEYVLIGFSFDGEKRFDFQAAGGDSAGGTPANADGVGMKFSTGTGGTLGGNGGTITVSLGSGTDTGASAGDFAFNFGAGAGGGGHNSRIIIDSSSAISSFNFLPRPGGSLKILDGTTGTDSIGLFPNSTGSVFSNASQNLSFNQKMGDTDSLFVFKTTSSAQSSVPAAFFGIELPAYVNIATEPDVIDVNISGGAGNVAFLGSHVGASNYLVAVNIDGRSYTSALAQTMGIAATLHLGSPSVAANISLTNGKWSLVTDDGIYNQGTMITGKIGINVTPTAAYITSGASGGEVTLAAPGGSGLLLSGNSAGITAYMQMNTTAGPWTDSPDISEIVFWGESNNNLVFQGYTSSVASPFNRLLWNSLHTQFTNGSDLTLIDPTTAIFEIVDKLDAVNLALHASIGKTSDALQILNSSAAKISFITYDGIIAALPVSGTFRGGYGVGSSSSMVSGGDITLSNNSTNVMFNLYRDPGGATINSANTGYGAAIGTNGGSGALDFYVSPSAGAQGAVVTPVQALSINQNVGVTFYGRRLGAQTNNTAANDLSLGTAGNTFIISGNTTINAISTTGWIAGSHVTLIFSGTPTVKNNTAGGAGTAKIFLNGSVDLVAAANTVLGLVYDGTQWQETSRKVA